MTDVPVHQEILFLDDFSHQNSDSVHWDHIKFNNPVYLDQIRIIPRNCSISLRNGFTHSGSTNPNKFKLDFYANNLNKKDQECATLDKIGSMLYDDTDYSKSLNDLTDHHDPLNNYILKPQCIPVDWLVIVGSYSSLSIAIIGVKAKQTPTYPIQPIRATPPQQQPQQAHILHQNNIPLLPIPPHLPNMVQSTSAPSLVSLPQTNQNRPPTTTHRFQQQQTQAPRAPPYTPNSIRHHPYSRQPLQQFNQPIKVSPSPPQLEPIKIEPKEEIAEETEVTTSQEEESVNDEPTCDSQLESNLVKHYLNLDEQKDESDLLEQIPNRAQIKQVSMDKNKLDEYLSEIFNPIEFRVRKKKQRVIKNLIKLNNLEQESIECKIESDDEIESVENLIDNLNLENFDYEYKKNSKLFVEWARDCLKTTGADLKQINLCLKLLHLISLKNKINEFLRDYSNTQNQEINGDLLSNSPNFQKNLIDLLEQSKLNESFQLKLLNCLNDTLCTSTSFDLFIQLDLYTKLIDLMSHKQTKELSSRFCLAISGILTKINFYESLTLFRQKCKLKFLAESNTSEFDSDFVQEISQILKSILVYLFKTQDDFTDKPMQNLFDSTSNSNLTAQVYTSHLRILDQTEFIKYLIIFWSYLFDYKQISPEIDEFLDQFLLPSDLNQYSHLGIEYLIFEPDLAHCLFEILLTDPNSSSALKLYYSVYILDLIDSLGLKLQVLKKHPKLIELLKSVELAQSLDLLLSTDLKQVNFLVHLLTMPDGNMSNKYIKILLDWFEYLIEDSLYVSDEEQGPTRCYLLNSFTNIFYQLCRLNKHWSLTTDSSNLAEVKHLNKLCSSLINYLIITKFKPSISKNQSYFVLIEKLKTIISILEPFVGSFKEKFDPKTTQCVKISFSCNTSVYLNCLIDSFRENIDKNLNLFFFKYFSSVKQFNYHVNCLRSNITQMRLIKNVLLPNKGSDKLRVSVKLIKKIHLGHLINRNMIHIIANFLARLNDYFAFYQAKLADSLMGMMEQLISLIEPAVYILKINMLNLINCRQDNFKDVYVLSILFDFYAWFNYFFGPYLQSIQAGLSRGKFKFEFKKNWSSKMYKELSDDFEKVNRYLSDVFIVCSQYLKTKFFSELAKFINKMPFNFMYGLNILSQCLPLPLEFSENGKIPNENGIVNERKVLEKIFKPLFEYEPHSYLVEEETIDEKKSSLVQMLCTLSLSSPKSKLNNLFLRVCIQLIDISKEICSSLLKVFLDYSIELITKIKQNFVLVEVEPEKLDTVNEDLLLNNQEMHQDTDDSLYDTNNLVENETELQNENNITEELKEHTGTESAAPVSSPDQIDQFKSSLVTNFYRLNKFLINLLTYEKKVNPIRIEFINLCKPGIVLSPSMNYSNYLLNFLKYFNQIDLNLENKTIRVSKEEFFRAQSAIVTLFESLLANLPELFIDDLRKSDFLADDEEKEEPFLDNLIRILLEHLNLTKLENLQVSTSVLGCLININRIHYYFYENVITDKTKIFFPLIKQHLKLKNSNNLLNFINELVNLLSNNAKSQSVELLLSKFFSYLNCLAHDLAVTNKLEKLNEILKWTEKNSNDILIDSISTSNPFSSNLQHCLINLDKQIESLSCSSSKEDSKKFKLVLNQSKRFLKILNDSELSKSLIQSEASMRLEEKVDLIEYYAKRNESKLSAEESLRIQSEWSILKNLEDIHDDLELLNTEEICPKQPVEGVLMLDKDLFKKLYSNLEEQLHQQQNMQQNDSESNLFKLEEESKVNRPVIDTRTGMRYKAPMRGGHNGGGGRSGGGLNSSVSSSSLPLLANPNQTTPMAAPGLVRHDSFRTRPPNTSRPPSLHVDDFYRIEQQQKQQLNSSSQNLNETCSSNENSLSRNNSLNDFSNSLNMSDLNKYNMINSTYPKQTPPTPNTNNTNNVNSSFADNDALNSSVNSLDQQMAPQQQQNYVSPATNHSNENNNLIMINSNMNKNRIPSSHSYPVLNNQISSNLNIMPNLINIQNNNLNSSHNNLPNTSQPNPSQFLNQIQSPLIKTSPNNNLNNSLNNPFQNQFQSSMQNSNNNNSNNQIHLIDQHRFNRPILNMQYSPNPPPELGRPFNQFNPNEPIFISNSSDNISMHINPIKSPPQLSPLQLQTPQPQQQQQQPIQPLLSPNQNIYNNNFRYQQSNQMRQNLGMQHGSMYSRGGMRRMPNLNQNSNNQNNSNNNNFRSPYQR